MVSNGHGKGNPEANGNRFLHADALYYGRKVTPSSLPSWVNPSPTPRVPMLAIEAPVLESTPPPHVMRGKNGDRPPQPRPQSRVQMTSCPVNGVAFMGTAAFR